jgi:integrase
MLLVQQYVSDNYGKKSESTLKNHVSSIQKLRDFTDAQDLMEITQRKVSEFKKFMIESENKKITTVNTIIKRIKVFFDWAITKGYIADNPAEEIKLIPETETETRWLTEEEEDFLISSIRKHYRGMHLKEDKKSFREEALVTFLLKTGLRVGELVSVKWDDITLSDTGSSVFVREGKDGKQRRVPLIPELVTILKLYDKRHGRKGEYVFYSKKSDTIAVNTVDYILKQFVGIENKKKNLKIDSLSAHRLRHTFGHNLVKNGVPLDAVARLLGHTKANGEPNISMTIRYTKTGINEFAGYMTKALSTN